MSGKMRTLRQHAPELLEATKVALRHLRSLGAHSIPSEESKREEVMELLRSVIDTADPPRFEEKLSSIRLVMTNPSAEVLLASLKSYADSDPHRFGAAHDAFIEGMRVTKQRVYLTLGIDHLVLRGLRYVLVHTNTSNQNKVFERLVKQIDQEGLSKNPMEILGQMGL